MKNIVIICGFFLLVMIASFYVGESSSHGPNSANVNLSAPDQNVREARLPNRSLEVGKPNSQVPKNEQVTNVAFFDPAIATKWDIKKTDADRAWQVSQGSRDVIVAVIDTGCDIKHESLKSNIWTNPGETGVDAKGLAKENNGIDDDGNGFVDDVHGWNFVANNNDLVDHHGHGTHIAGIVGADGGSSKAIGIAPKVSMMILKYFEVATPTDNLKNTIQAIKYAVKMHANIINYSGGGIEYSKEEHDAVEMAEKAGILFVAAAGNERSNSDKHKYYPADYSLSNIISVTTIDRNNQVLASSNWGTETVDIAAPGEEIYSTLPNNLYGKMTGTSQATGMVTGAAAVIMAHKKAYDASEVRKYILATGDSDVSLLNKTRTARRLNLYKALTTLDSGIGVSGIKMANSVPTSGPTENTNAINTASFGKDLLKALGQKQGQAGPTE